jgi:iron complex outermembrane receptor protein
VDALLHYNIQEWKVSLNASNLLDKNYVQHCAAVSQCFYGARRSLFVTLGRKW